MKNTPRMMKLSLIDVILPKRKEWLVFPLAFSGMFSETDYISVLVYIQLYQTFLDEPIGMQT